MKIVIFRKYCFLNLFFFMLMVFVFFASFVNCFVDYAKLMPSIAGTVSSFMFSFFWLWMILRNYLQIFVFKKDGIYTNKGFKNYLHFDYKDIKGVKIVAFDCPPKFKKGTKIIGVDSVLSAPKKNPKQWIIITDGREEDNLCNYTSYFVPIREHMVIKFEYSKKRVEMIANYVNCNIEFQTVSSEEIQKARFLQDKKA